MTPSKPSNFIRDIIDTDLKSGKNGSRVVTRFPPEPNGYLHIGHAKSICLNFGIARDYQGVCHLRFDDTNPSKEDVEYVESIKEDVRWLGFDWGKNLFHASDYFEKCYLFAEQLIEKGLAYVDRLTPEQMREYRGTLTEPGRPCPDRDRPIAENLDLFRRMRGGEFPDGKYTLRAKIDMASPNINLRDPALYRIRKVTHQATGDQWCIYPMYDYAHCISDMIEGITHSICTLEFEDHRPLYDWVLDVLKTPCHPQQIEFARLNLTYTVMSKRKLLQLVQEKMVNGWDDPRMPTIAGMRRRGYTPEAIREFCDRIGVAKSNSTVEFQMLEFCIREYLNKNATRRMAILHPLKVVITNYPEGPIESLDAMNNPENPEAGRRSFPFSREIFIDHDDFRMDPPKDYFRLSPGKEVRLKNAYLIKCEKVIADSNGNPIELQCTYDNQSKGGKSSDGRKVKGIIQWVSSAHAIEAEVRLYSHLFNHPNPGSAQNEPEYRALLNPESRITLRGCKLEPNLKEAQPGERFQFERVGYFIADSIDSKPGALVFNRIVTLHDSWAKVEKGGK